METLISRGYRSPCEGLKMGASEQSAIACVRGRWRLSWAREKGVKQTRTEGKEGGENEREEGIERETMGARGTSRHTHTYSPSCAPGLDLHWQHHTCKSIQHRLCTRSRTSKLCRNCVLCIVKWYRFAYTNLQKHTEDIQRSFSTSITDMHTVCTHTLCYSGAPQGGLWAFLFCSKRLAHLAPKSL